jgi:hypothetical protein
MLPSDRKETAMFSNCLALRARGSSLGRAPERPLWGTIRERNARDPTAQRGV